MTWLQIIKDGLAVFRAIQEKTRPVCSCDKCPLGYNVPKGVKKEPSADEMIARQEALYKRNHPDGR